MTRSNLCCFCLIRDGVEWELNPMGICERCGTDAEEPDVPAESEEDDDHEITDDGYPGDL